MARTGINLDQVMMAAEQIVSQGESPTIEKVRFMLGAGSNTTISKFLNQWKQQSTFLVDDKRSREFPPDVVKTAVDRVWQEMQGQTDAAIEKIKNETQEQIDIAEMRVQTADTNFKQLQVEHAELSQVYRTQSAEKELLLLDIKRLQEEQALLQERYQGLEQRYTDMQGLTAKHLTDVTHAHQNEIARLEEQCRRQDESHTKLVNEIKQHSENERHQLILALDNLKVENQKQVKLKNEVQSNLQEELRHTTKLETDLKALVKERDEALARLAEQREQWVEFHNKAFVADEMLAKIVAMPTLDFVLDQLNTHFTKIADKKLSEFKESIQLLKIEKEMETQDE